MAINPAKLLPPSGGALAVRSKTIDIGKKKEVGIEGQVLIIKTQVIKIEKLITRGYTLKLKEQKEEQKENETKKRAKREEELEEKKAPKEGKGKIPALPKLGFLDRIRKFIGNMLLAYFAVRLIDHLPKLVPFAYAVGYAAEFLLNVGGNLLNSLVTFVDWGYKAYDATRGFLKNLGGENFAKVFDGFNGALGTLIETAIITAVTLSSFGGDGGGVSPSAPKRGFDTKGRRVSTDVQKRYAQRFGKDQFLKRFGQKNVINLGEKGASKSILKFTKPFLKRLPIIGALIDFGLSVALGEDPGRAAFKAIGAGIFGSIGAAIGSLAFGFGGIVGGILGSIGGDAIGGALYDVFFGNKKPQPKKQKVQGKAGGGITRGGKKQGAIRRTGGITGKGKIKRKTRLAQKPREVEFKSPGVDIGGEEKLFGIFPNPLKAAQKAIDTVNPFKAIENTGKNLGKSDYFGPILAITSKITLGQKPTQQDYKNVGLGINLLFNEGMNKGQLVGGVAAAYAEGGFVDKKALEAVTEGGDITNWVAKSFKEATETNAQKTLREIRENANKKKEEPTSTETPTPSDIGIDGAGTDGGGTADTSLNPYRRAFLDTLAFAEGTSKYPNTGYNTMFTGKQFSGYKDHPRQIQVSGRYRSDAAGRYQFLSTTWDGLGLPDFSPANQDKGALKLLAPHVLTAIDKGDFATAFHGARKTWASLPGAGYGQPEKKMKTLVEYANTRLSKYKKGEIGKPIIDEIDLKDLGDVKGYRVTRSGATIKNYSELPPHHTYQTTSDGRRVQDFTLYKGKDFVNVPVPSPVSGKVTWTGNAGNGGNWVEIQSNEGKVELGHFNKISAKVGQSVQAFKSVLGLQGYTGRISPSGPDGTHVHIQASDKVIGRYVNSLARGSAFHGENFGVVPKDGFTLRLHKGEMYKVIDKDSVDLLGFDLTKEIIDIENRSQLIAKAPSIIEKLKVISGYASYESEAPQTVIIQDNPFEIMEQEPMVAIMGGSSGGGDSYDPFAMLDRLSG